MVGIARNDSAAVVVGNRIVFVMVGEIDHHQYFEEISVQESMGISSKYSWLSMEGIGTDMMPILTVREPRSFFARGLIEQNWRSSSVLCNSYGKI